MRAERAEPGRRQAVRLEDIPIGQRAPHAAVLPGGGARGVPSHPSQRAAIRSGWIRGWMLCSGVFDGVERVGAGMGEVHAFTLGSQLAEPGFTEALGE